MDFLQSHIRRLYRLRHGVMRKVAGQLKLLLTNFEGTPQQRDIEKTTPLIEQFFRVKVDVKSWREPNFDWDDEEAIWKSIVDHFNMPTWALYRLKGVRKLCKELRNYNEVFIYQLKGCNLHCVYCFVDDWNKDGRLSHEARFFSLDEILSAFYRERERRKLCHETPLNRIRPSGGEPTLVIEQLPELLHKLEEAGLEREVHVQSDTNLTTGHFIDWLEAKGEVQKGILEEIASYKNFSLLASFKGTDPKNFSHNVRVSPKLFEEQFYSFKKWLDAGVDVYPFLYNPNPASLGSFMDRFAHEVGEGAYLKTWVFSLKMYETVKARLRREAVMRGVDPDQYIRAYAEEWQRNYEESEKFMKALLLQKYGLPYKRFLRAGLSYRTSPKNYHILT